MESLTLRAGSFQSLYSNFKVNIWLWAAFVFVAVKAGLAGKTDTWRPISLISRHSLGIYAIHAAAFSVSSDLLRIPRAAIAIPVKFTISPGISLALSIVLKKIPILRKIV